MNSKRSYWTLILASAALGLLIENCTIKTSSDDGTGGTGTISGSCSPGQVHNSCTCTGNVLGSQTCNSSSTWDACVCLSSSSGGSSSSTGGASTATGGASNTSGGSTPVAGSTSSGTSGASTGGASTGTSGASTGGATASGGSSAIGLAGASMGEGGEGGAIVIDSTDCEGCLAQLCKKEWQACEADNETTAASGDGYCLSTGTDGTGQIEKIVSCVTTERASGLAKRDVVRACGATIGDSSDPQFVTWAPPDMTQATTNLMNCMADAPGASVPGAWATDATNFPAGGPAPWVAGTCAKLACTSQLQ